MSVRRALAVAAALPLLLAGCSEGEAEPKMPDPSPSSSSSTPTAEPTVEQESPEEFVRRWVRADREMQNSGEVDDYLALSKRCKPCKSVAERVQAIFEAGGYVKTDGLVIRRITDNSGGDGPKVLDVSVRSSPTVLKESADAEPQTLPGGDVVYRMRLSPQAPWELLNLTQLAS